jgi:hypothetical protein
MPVASEVRAERKRFKGQCGKILAMLEAGTTSNNVLACVSLKYTSRLSDLRQAGYDIRVDSRDYSTGLTTYRLWTDGDRWGATVGECDLEAERQLRGL